MISRSWISLVKSSVRSLQIGSKFWNCRRNYHLRRSNKQRLHILQQRNKRRQYKCKGRQKKLKLEGKMFETFNHLLSMDVSLMSNGEKIDHAATMKSLKKLFVDN